MEENQEYKKQENFFSRITSKIVAKIMKTQFKDVENIIKSYHEKEQLLFQQIQLKNQEIQQQQEFISNMYSMLCQCEQNIRDNNKRIENLAQNAPDCYSQIDYFDFENHFRGDEIQIKDRQKRYLPYFVNRKNVVDLGCGRGEMLQLLEENSIKAIGIDMYLPFVDYCRNKGMEVRQGDALEVLKTMKTVDGIFVGQVVEHLSYAQIIELCNVAFQRLEVDCYLVLETPNPRTLLTFCNAFFMDPSHRKLVHPFTLKYLVEKAGFKDVKIEYTEESRVPNGIPPLEGSGIGNLESFNKSMGQVSNILYGSQDYAIIARK